MAKTEVREHLIKAKSVDGHLKISIDIDLKSSLQSLEYDIKDYGFGDLTINKLEKVLREQIIW